VSFEITRPLAGALTAPMDGSSWSVLLQLNYEVTTALRLFRFSFGIEHEIG
jgi:hypothetical protein